MDEPQLPKHLMAAMEGLIDTGNRNIEVTLHLTAEELVEVGTFLQKLRGMTKDG